MPQKERLRVWKGELKKTAGGLTKADLIKNKRGRIVSKKKSLSAKSSNNLDKWLRKPGDSFGGKLKDAGLPAPAVKGSKPKQKVPKPKPKPKAPKKAAPKQAPKPKPASKAPVKKKKEPAGAGKIPNRAEVDIGNILQEAPLPKSWPSWTQKVVTNRYVRKDIERALKKYDKNPDWTEIKKNLLKRRPNLKQLL